MDLEGKPIYWETSSTKRITKARVAACSICAILVGVPTGIVIGEMIASGADHHPTPQPHEIVLPNPDPLAPQPHTTSVNCRPYAEFILC